MRSIFCFLVVVLTANLNAQELYDPAVVTTIDLTFAVNNWDAVMDQYYAAGDEQRLEATAVINGQTFEGVGVKYKGNSTYNANNAKNPINIKLDYTIEQDYQGYNTLKLANGSKDPSWVREVLSYEITRKYMQAPKSNCAWVTINGSVYGLMCSSESVNSAFIDSHFYSDNDNVFFKCNPVSVMGNGNPVAGCDDSNNCSLEYLGTDSACYYAYYELQSDAGWSDLKDLTQNISTDFLNHEEFLDRDRFIWMLAMNNVTVNLDSYTGPFVQNYYLYKDDQNIHNPVMWDFNQGFGSFSMINTGGGPGTGSTTTQLQEMDPFIREGDAEWPMINKILADPTLKRMYVAHCKTILEENFLNDFYIDRAQAFQSVADPFVQIDPNDFYTYANFTANLNSTVNTGTGMGGGNMVGITLLMEARKEFMMNTAEFGFTPPSISDIQAPISVSPNSIATITASVSGSNYVMLGHRTNETQHFTHEEMFDDGLHNDGSSGDGIFGFIIPAVPMGGVQYFIYAENTEAGIFSPVRAEKEFFRIGTTASLVLNEFQSNNSTTVADEAGDHADWIELYNATSSSLDLSDYYLSDELDNPLKFQMPASIINPGEYFIIWCDEEQTEGANHANFKLPSEGGETITLANSQAVVIDAFFLPSQSMDVTFGRLPNGNGPSMPLTSTFNAANSNVVAVSELELNGLLIYPNPASDIINLTFQGSDVANVYILDLTGKLISTLRTDGRMNMQLDISNLSTGSYVIKAGSASLPFMKL